MLCESERSVLRNWSVGGNAAAPPVPPLPVLILGGVILSRSVDVFNEVAEMARM